MGRKNGKKKNKPVTPSKTFTGKLEVTRSGMGFLIVEGLDEDIMVKPSDFYTAFDGDIVKVQTKPAKEGKKDRVKGVVVEVVQRNKTSFIGTISMSKTFAFLVHDQKGVPDLYISKSKLNGAKDNDKVVVRFIGWEDPSMKPEGEVVEVLKGVNDGDLAMKEILLDAGFSLEFSDEAKAVANSLADTISKTEIKKRRDLRDVFTFTIDPHDAKDFDDAISYKVIKKGLFEIGVHIADVSHYVTPGNALDREAYGRATSVYLPDRVCPMLPEHISNVLCSLRPHEDKLTFSAIFQLNAKGEVKEVWYGRTVIHSNHRYTYEEAQEIIETGEGDNAEVILQINKITRSLRKERFTKGAINFSSQEVRFVLDGEGNPIGITIKESKEAHQLIEELMLLANKYVAQKVEEIRYNNKSIPFPYRVHDKPDEEKLYPFMAFADQFGYKFDISSPEAIATSFNTMLQKVQGRPEQHVLEQLGIRTMAKAKYTTQNIGHYGLGFESYCHFTSPIRRYPDVLVHRVLQEVLDNNVHVDNKMEEKALHCSERERSAMEAERTANKYKQVQYMQQFIGEEFEGVISGVSGFGFWVETVAHKCEGLVSIQDLIYYDDFVHDEAGYALKGRRTGVVFRMGDKITIKVLAANLEKRQLDYGWVPQEVPAEKKKAPAKKKKTIKPPVKKNKK